MNLFIIVTLEQEKGVLRQNPRRAVILGIEMDVLFRSSAYCCSLFLMMLVAGSSGTDINSALTSYDVIHFLPQI